MDNKTGLFSFRLMLKSSNNKTFSFKHIFALYDWNKKKLLLFQYLWRTGFSYTLGEYKQVILIEVTRDVNTLLASEAMYG